MAPGKSEFFELSKEGEFVRRFAKKGLCTEDIQGPFCFIANQNLHSIPSQCRGVLIVVNVGGKFRLGVVAKYFVHELVIMALISMDNDFRPFVQGINAHWKGKLVPFLIRANNAYVRCVQQVKGPRFLRQHASVYPYPLMGARGTFSTAPVFEDILPSPSLNQLPQVESKTPFSFRLYWNQQAKKFKDPPTSKVDVIFVRTSDGLVKQNNNKNSFGVVYDSIYEHDRYVLA